MSFVSWEFLALFAAVLIGLRVMPTREARQALILLASVVFYGSGTAWHLLVLATPALVDYACAIRIEESGDAHTRKRWLVFSLVSNLGLLAYFKYANFFADTVAALLGVSTAPLDIALPVGISFFIFKTLSYSIDVYRRELAACRSLWRYGMFVSYFPELVAGPIVRASVFLPQLTRALEPSRARAASGFRLALLGLSKKLLVADRLAIMVDPVFADPAAYSQGTVAAAIVAYSLQIYCDFSGYSDMAIGISRVIGFDLPENFHMPYAATSITDFWRRWHITLSTWLRDYLYIPLGGNRKGQWRTYVNLMVTMLLGGLWHGASWTFVFWGAWHGAGLAVHKAIGGAAARSRSPGVRDEGSGVRGDGSGALRPNSWLLTPLRWASTYVFVCIGWVFFRAKDFPTAWLILRKLAGLEPGGLSWFYLPFWLAVAAVILAHGLALRAESRGEPLPLSAPARTAFAGAFVVTLWLIGIFLLSPIRTSPFIYFQF